MIWQDFATRETLGDRDIAEGIAVGLGLEPKEVLVHHGDDSFPEVGDAKAVCVAHHCSSGFRLVLSVFTYFDSPRLAEPLDVIAAFAWSTMSDCLMEDLSPNPYTMVLVDPAGRSRQAMIDVEQFDNTGEYHVVGS